MIFNSFEFIVYFILFFGLYWHVFHKNVEWQNLLLLAGSYIFYAWWDWRFLMLIIGYSAINFILGKLLHSTTNLIHKKLYLKAAITVGLGNLIFFKYYNFFIEALLSLFSSFNIELNLHSIKVILPLGISFYTFRSLSYIFDINIGKIKPENNWINYFTFVAFFPTLLSGPIDKARTFLPQLRNKRTFNYPLTVDGLRQILLGLFKKVVIADNCAFLTNKIFENYETLPASALLLGAFYYTIQVYADFSGYSDMAIGISKLLGINVTKNFDFPFFAKNIAEFWRKWHISLTTWMTEYVYTPLTISFRNLGNLGIILAIIINFLAIGIWHGANWTFVIFGLIHGILFIPLILNGTLTKRKKKILKPSLKTKFSLGLSMLGTFLMVMLTVILFRAENLSHATAYFLDILSPTLFKWPVYFSKTVLLLILLLFTFEWIQQKKEHALQLDTIKIGWLRYVIYYSLVLIILTQGHFMESGFIYFNF